MENEELIIFRISTVAVLINGGLKHDKLRLVAIFFSGFDHGMRKMSGLSSPHREYQPGKQRGDTIHCNQNSSSSSFSPPNSTLKKGFFDGGYSPRNILTWD